MNSIYTARLSSLRNHLELMRIDIALLVNPTHIYFFTGFHSNPHERFMALAIDTRQEEALLFVPELDLDAAQADSWVKEVIPVSETDDPFQLVRTHIGGAAVTIGLEKITVSLDWSERLLEWFPDAQLRDIDSFIKELRLVKTEDDLDCLRFAVTAVEQALDQAIHKIKPGMTELELTAELEYQMRICGGEKPAFESIVLAGRRTALPHGKPGHNRMERGDFVLIDIGVFAKGFNSDITRTFLLGDGTKEQEQMYEVVLEANRQAIMAVREDVPFGHLDQAARRVIEHAGYGSYFTHRVGHGLGLEIHESPSIHGGNELPIKAGHVFTIEPGIYIPSIGGVRIEDDVCIRPDGSVEVLTKYPKALRKLCN